MTYEINETHDPNLKSWVESANDPNNDFPIQNLPFCVFTKDGDFDEMLGTVIGDFVVDLKYFIEKVVELKYFNLNGSAAQNLANISQFKKTDLRSGLIKWLSESADEYAQSDIRQAMTPISEVSFEVPYPIGDYTDFYASVFHATNVGSMFRPDNPLLPNYKYLPIGYHGRASSIVISGTKIKRPKGQNRTDTENPPVYIPCKNLDYEMEVGFFVGRGNDRGETIPIGEAEEHIFGLCLVNDWSARDIQGWEYQPLGPFLAKNFATSISPFVVTIEALAPFRTAAFARPEGDPAPLPYLTDEQNQKFGGLDINLEVLIASQKMRDEKIAPMLLSKSNMKDLYWTIGQMLTHHASGGCNLQTGDLMASGTVSGKEKSERGCLLELTWRGKEPLTLPTGEERRFLEDGDEVIMRGYCEREGFRRIGFGECRGIILPAD
ncbi:MAG TPA: fumarylacetoacetase [Pyrinomonadaceae bacterium]|jgi:fumarylacetoacetase|nr:fumarylacetoacetase [Pyrinomonadaceae bacterium]